MRKHKQLGSGAPNFGSVQRFWSQRIIVDEHEGSYFILMDLDQERAVIEQAKQDSGCFGVLFDQYYSTIFNYNLRRTRDPAIAQELTAETFFKALVGIRKFKWRGISICNWFYHIATNEQRIYYRKHKYASLSLEALFEQDGYEPVSDYSVSEELLEAERHIERHEEFVRASIILTTLPLKYQEVITLRFAEKKKLSEIAVILGKKEGTVKSLLSRGLGQLRGALTQSGTQPSDIESIVLGEGTLLTTPQEAYEE